MLSPLSGAALFALLPVPFAAIDGVGIPEIGWTTGWVGLFVFGVLFARGKMLTEKDHLERMEIQERAHAQALAAKDAEIDRVDHDRQEWRTESRIKDAQLSEAATQHAEKDKQLASMGELARTLEAVLTAIRPLSGGTS